MLRSFLETFTLFPYVYLSGWVTALFFPLLGIPLIGTGRLYLGFAIGGGAIFGAGLGLILSLDLPGEILQPLGSGVFGLLTALAVGSGFARPRTQGKEILFVYLFLGSATFLILSPTPHGVEDVQKVLMSTVLGATRQDFILLTVLGILYLGVLLWKHDEIRLLILDPEFAGGVGVSQRRWEFFFSLYLGITMGVGLHTVGLTYMLGVMILPALVGERIVSTLRELFWVAPVLSFLTAVLGFILGNRWDLPQTHTTLVLFGIEFLVVFLIQSVWGRLIRRG